MLTSCGASFSFLARELRSVVDFFLTGLLFVIFFQAVDAPALVTPSCESGATSPSSQITFITLEDCRIPAKEAKNEKGVSEACEQV